METGGDHRITGGITLLAEQFGIRKVGSVRNVRREQQLVVVLRIKLGGGNSLGGNILGIGVRRVWDGLKTLLQGEGEMPGDRECRVPFLVPLERRMPHSRGLCLRGVGLWSGSETDTVDAVRPQLIHNDTRQRGVARSVGQDQHVGGRTAELDVIQPASVRFSSSLSLARLRAVGHMG